MSNTSKTIIGILVVVVIIIGIVLLAHNSSTSNSAYQAPSDQTQTGQYSSAPGADDSTSDASINQDTANIDAQMNDLNSDSSNTSPSNQ